MVPALISAAVAFAVLAISQWIIYRRERSRMLLGKAEELYLLLLDLGERNGERFDPIVRAAYNQGGRVPEELSVKRLTAADIREKVKLLIDFYFPALDPDLEKLFASNRACIGILVQPERARPPYSAISTISEGFAEQNAILRNRIVTERRLLTKTLSGDLASRWDWFCGQ